MSLRWFKNLRWGDGPPRLARVVRWIDGTRLGCWVFDRVCTPFQRRWLSWCLAAFLLGLLWSELFARLR